MPDPTSSVFGRLAALVREVAKTALASITVADRDANAWERVEFSEGQGGLPPRRIDRLLHQTWRDGLASDLDLPLLVLGEEVDDVGFDTVEDGAFVAVVDPIDGTTNWLTLGFGAAMSVVVYRKLGSELLYAGVSVVQIGWRRHWWAEPTATWRGSVDQPVDVDEQVVSARPLRRRTDAPWVVGGVGAGGGATRRFLDFLTHQAGMRTVTLGGTPLGPEVLDRELVALVECDPTTVFDSAHLMLAANTDAVVATLAGQRLPPEELRTLFCRVRRAKERVVPPYILGKNDEVVDQVAAAFAAAGKG